LSAFPGLNRTLTLLRYSNSYFTSNRVVSKILARIRTTAVAPEQRSALNEMRSQNYDTKSILKLFDSSQVETIRHRKARRREPFVNSMKFRSPFFGVFRVGEG
jgi:hypothetical protein